MSNHGCCDRCNAQDVELFVTFADEGNFCGPCVDILKAQYDAEQAACEATCEQEEEEYYEREDHFRDDVEADADALASAGYGTDEDYGMYDDGGYEADFGMCDE